MSDSILFSVEQDVGYVTFNRPSRLNAIDLEMGRAMRDLARDLPRRDDARAIVLRGAGPSFMAGGDVELFLGEPRIVRDTISELIDCFHVFTIALQELAQPVIGSVRGAAAGGGFSLAIGTDLTLASDTATFQPAYIRLGTTPDGGGTFFLSRLVGSKRAMEIFLLADPLTAAEAARLGIVNRVVPDADLDRETRQLATRLCRNSPAAARRTKALLTREGVDLLKRQLAAEKASFLECVGTPEFTERVASFLSKRAAAAPAALE